MLQLSFLKKPVFLALIFSLVLSGFLITNFDVYASCNDYQNNKQTQSEISIANTLSEAKTPLEIKNDNQENLKLTKLKQKKFEFDAEISDKIKNLEKDNLKTSNDFSIQYTNLKNENGITKGIANLIIYLFIQITPAVTV
jgi:hypothetical protein